MSDYTDDIMAHYGILGKFINFIQKPLSVQPLAKKVRDVLDRQKCYFFFRKNSGVVHYYRN